MSRKSRRFADAPAAGDVSANQIISLFGCESESTRKAEEEQSQTSQSSEEKKYSFRLGTLKQNWKRSLLYLILGTAFIVLLVLGVMAGNGWLPRTDSLSGKRTGWFGRDLQANNLGSSGSNILPFEPMPTPTPQLSKEYIYAGSRMLAVEDAGANAAPPADLAVWRRSSGTWYVKDSSTGNMVTAQLGQAGDIPSPGDFDGDGRTDFCVFRPAVGRSPNSYWYITTNSSSQSLQFGLNGDKPAVADYDGDGKSDIAVFRPTNQYWYSLRSSDSTFQSIQFGTTGDVPVPADYDGDGKADVAQYRTTTAEWFMLLSGSGNAFLGQQFGQANTDNAVTGDFDGDGKYDLATWRTSNNTWNIKQSSNNAAVSISWGDNLIDTAVQGDFDADGKTDIAVWRNQGGSVGLWLIRNSSTGQTRTDSWGTTGDIPVPAPYRR